MKAPRHPDFAVANVFCGTATILLLGQPAAGQAQPPQPAAAPPPVEDANKDWKVMLGVGVCAQPEYEGDDKYGVGAIPVLMLSYRDVVFLRGPVLGANAITVQGPRPDDKLRIGPLIRYKGGRDEDDSSRLRGMGDIDGGIELGGFITYGIGARSADLTVFQDVGGSHDGLTAKLSMGYRHTLGPGLKRPLLDLAQPASCLLDHRHGRSRRGGEVTGPLFIVAAIAPDPPPPPIEERTP